ncbi:class II histocompatibility antigen, M alpha chain [Alligator mississippiensis]|uniref:class II histocompatibility antigen, M alpha chain n=1 Tax=Alligator mississippiensis TaxID=8496 RepID=UPI0028779BDC|nr:class II histocompatibility antigen, M alpha chain [Alligator mississippiensis]
MWGWGLLAMVLLWGAVAQDETPHLLSQVLFCQPDSPSLGRADTFDEDQLFWFDFPSSHWLPRLPDFAPRTSAQSPPAQIVVEAGLCKELLRGLSQMAHGFLPEAKGIPMANIFTAEPLELGQPNTLICQVGNIFPASVAVSWQHNGVPVTQGVNTTPYNINEDLALTVYSTLPFTPHEGDVYACNITRQRERFSTLTYWVPQDPIPSKLLETSICYTAIALGIVLFVAGVVLLVLSRRLRNQDEAQSSW